MTVAAAKKTLSRAFAELDQADGDLEVIRQVAEKGWRAAREAVYAVMACKGERPSKGTITVGEVAKFEATALGRPRGRSPGQPLADGYARAMDLHGDCFYEGKCESKSDLHGELERVHVLIEQAEADATACRPTTRQRR